MSDDVIDIDPGEFRRVLGAFPTGVTVIAAVADGKPAGLAVGSFFSVSLEPPLVGFCVQKSSSSWARIRTADHFVVNVLGEQQGDVSNRFASKVEDKFDGIDWTPAVRTGGPRLEGCLAHIDCTPWAVYDGGDHDIVVGRVEHLELHTEESGPLVFFRGSYGRIAPLD